ncbi:MAG: molybdopterin molybdotransferase MoeA [Clostridiales bacterium]|nr:molybdopterin molybdotransferase MoeA [Clostridiales bacterium]
MIELEKAQELISNKVQKAKTEQISILDAVGRVLAEDIISNQNYPPFDRSPLDGYAVRAEDIPGKLKIIDKIYAGDVSQHQLTEGTAIRIMTGAPIPKGANCIVRQEDTDSDGEYVKVHVKHKPYDNYVYKGEDIKSGVTVLEKTKLLDSADIMGIASLGLSKVLVYKKPVVGVLSSGNELQELDTELLPGHIYNGNSYFIYSRLLELGAEPKLYNNIEDDMDKIVDSFQLASSECDLLITTGGVSVGEKDLMREGAVKAGYEILFWQVNLKPGSPMFAAIKNKNILLGLSGNPLAMATTFELMMRPILDKHYGFDRSEKKKVLATMAEPLENPSKKRRFIRVKTVEENGMKKVYIGNISQQPGRLFTLLKTNGILELKPFTKFDTGDKVTIIEL